ncbi:MAG: class I SAM-dependent methyltransferase [Anaerolineales bacterium]|nr:class I SAM-dependent methyltransferase [Anaerolineales bacterium]MCX7608177.1 class I SAM-dependent methyltransferase [Anaerolineales bacterium]MDW8226346.1 class I SAM-dependent methyltransferase [Anaerolineales bacterium]
MFRRLIFVLYYLRQPPWDSGIVPPEVEEFIATHPPGRALDLGCGTGTSSLALARAGWSVIGIDFVPRAIKIAQQKAKAQHLSVDFGVADVTRLPTSLLNSSFSLVLDIGCFHSLSERQKHLYLEKLPLLLAPGGTWLLYGFFKPTGSPGPGLTKEDLSYAERILHLVKRQDGVDKRQRSSVWLWFETK